MKLNERLSQPQAKFALWIELNTPYLVPLFDFNERVYHEEKVEHFLSVASHGEAIMARFVLGVWRNEDEFNFDFIEAASVLDRNQRQVITNWMLDPFFP